MQMDADHKFVQSLGCQYLGPDYDPQTYKGPTPYCGCKTLVGTSLYCQEHYPKIYAQGSALRRRHKDTRRAEALRQLQSDFNAVIEELEAEGFDLYGDSELERPIA